MMLRTVFSSLAALALTSCPVFGQNLFRTSPRPDYARADALPDRLPAVNSPWGRDYAAARYAEGIGRVPTRAARQATARDPRVQQAWENYVRELQRFRRRQFAAYRQTNQSEGSAAPLLPFTPSAEAWSPSDNPLQGGHRCPLDDRSLRGRRVPADFPPRLSRSGSFHAPAFVESQTEVLRANELDYPVRANSGDSFEYGEGVRFRPSEYRHRDFPLPKRSPGVFESGRSELPVDAAFVGDRDLDPIRTAWQSLSRMIGSAQSP